jgi:hypothetical protein
MTVRRQVLRSCAPLATCFFLPALKVPHDLNQRLAILALVLGFLSALTFILWRYHRRDYASLRRIGRRI